jgi:hypothetical protein
MFKNDISYCLAIACAKFVFRRYRRYTRNIRTYGGHVRQQNQGRAHGRKIRLAERLILSEFFGW